MANRTNVSQIPYNSPGVYFTETDLTVISRQTGGFSAAQIGLMEKGPAFEITNATTFEDRAYRMGDLNPDFPTSYYAKQYLEQAKNFKEVRILGLEGYKDTVGYAITLSGVGSVAADISNPNNPIPLTVGPLGLMAVLKARRSDITGGPQVVSVAVSNATYTDPLTGGTVTRATDYLFTLTISYKQPTSGSIAPDVVICSLRPESKDFLSKKFGTDPRKSPKIGTRIAPLWVDMIVPSVKSKPTIDLLRSYYIPGTIIAQNYLDVTIGETVFGTTFTFQSAVVTSVVGSSSATVVTVNGDITAWLSNGDAVEITGIQGTGNIGAANGTWYVSNVVFASGHTTFHLLDINTSNPLNIIIPSSAISGGTPLASKYIIPTWENDVLDFDQIGFKTPVTPWFVTDGDANGHYKNLFRFWSISDGTSANTDIKIELANINPNSNSGNGSFDIIVRRFADTEDVAPVRLEIFANLNMDPLSDNYVVRRIGDGDEFGLRSRYIFIELNKDEELEIDHLPWGILGYPNTFGTKFRDLPWTVDYDKNKVINKQTLGLAHNSINMNSPVQPADLDLKNSNNIFGKGFHLNPLANSALTTNQSSVFVFAAGTIYTNASGNVVVPSEKVKRNKFVVGFYGGFDGFNVYNERAWGDPTSADFQALQMGIAALKDKEDINSDFTVLVTPDMNFQDHASGCDEVLDMINTRGDCLYIPDFAYDADADSVAAVDAVLASNLISNNVALYFPWLQFADSVNKTNPWLPPSLLALGTITYVATNENVWQPPGGSIRTVTNNLVRSRRRLDLNDRETLFTANINPITTFPGSGYEIAGVRTTQDVFSALSFIHNRLLLCYAKKVLNQILRPLLFQMNNGLTGDAFLTTVRPIFDRIKKLNGLADYAVEIVKNDQTAADKTTIYGRVIIVPLYPVERIVVDFTLSDTVTFSQ